MADTTSEQAQPAPMPAAPEGLSEDAKQQVMDVRAAIGIEVRETTDGFGQSPGPQPDQELAQRQFAFERSVTADEIQRTNDVKGPGE
ncbi:MAG: hypothetical protein KIT17_00990 [Rubrivivax sp.]|nr:hypothetical protein [Rubrivivax sp.]